MADGGALRKLTLAQQADRHEYYEAAVQCVEADCDFIAETFRELRGRGPRTLREDFCGTARLAAHWVQRNRGHRAIGVDLDTEVLDWGRRRHIARLTRGEQRRVQLIQADVLKVAAPDNDVVTAFNFSYWVFKTRKQMTSYFRSVYRSLADDGIFFLDAFGGYEAYQEMRETTDHGDFQYIWEQVAYRPVTGDYLCHIHFRFADGSRLNKAFTYDWRLWSLPELREMLLAAGFGDVTVYWEGAGRDGTGNGIFKPEPAGEADAGWVAYVVAAK
jgi:cyclopropane fatty-acyl-phospholipid synthase-like methyltransferase